MNAIHHILLILTEGLLLSRVVVRWGLFLRDLCTPALRILSPGVPGLGLLSPGTTGLGLLSPGVLSTVWLLPAVLMSYLKLTYTYIAVDTRKRTGARMPWCFRVHVG